jgi:general secretion pathway protein J
VEVLAEDIDHFDVRYLDAATGLWTESWDSSQAIGQPHRLPFEIKITLALKGGLQNKPIVFLTKLSMPMQAPLTFAVPR